MVKMDIKMSLFATLFFCKISDFIFVVVSGSLTTEQAGSYRKELSWINLNFSAIAVSKGDMA